MKPVKLSELIEVLEFDSDEYTNRVDLQNGCVVRLPNSLLSAAEEGDEALDSLADWEKEEVEIAKAIAADSGERFVDAPGKFEFHEYRQMERFIGTVEDSEAADQLSRFRSGSTCRSTGRSSTRSGRARTAGSRSRTPLRRTATSRCRRAARPRT